jgi:hypothetical protein
LPPEQNPIIFRGGGMQSAASVGGSASATDSSTGTGSGSAGIGNLLPWLYPTADFKNFDKGPFLATSGSSSGAVALPAVGSWADILIFSLEPGRAGKITQLGIDFIVNGGAVFTQGIVPAQMRFFIGVNGSPAIAGRPGKPFPDYASFSFLPGAVSAPTPINGLMLRERDEVHIAVQNLSVVVTTQFLAARALGYSFSKKYWSRRMGPQ